MPKRALDDQEESCLNPYEQRRLENIARNKQVLASMGIVSAWRDAVPEPLGNKNRRKRQPVAPKENQKPAKVQSSEPARRSSRLKGEAAEEIAEFSGVVLKRQVRILLPRKRLQELDDSRSAALHSHNLMRLQSMSDEAMLKRIQKIRRVDKMESLIEVLQGSGREEVLAAAEAQLSELL